VNTASSNIYQERLLPMGIFDWKHWLVLLAVVILIFGTKKIKGLGADVGEAIKGFRNAMADDKKNEGSTASQSATLEQSHIIDVKSQTVREPCRSDF
jgi:sec-independent protein translocase protein TatA